MHLSKDVVEPAVVVGIFTAGALASRRRGRARLYPKKADVDAEDGHVSRGDTPAKPPLHLLARFWTKFPFLEEIWYWLLTVYQLLRALSARMIAGDQAVFDTARRHALQVLHLESLLHIDVERSFQEAILTRHAWLVPFLAQIYYAHISVGVCFLAYSYTYCPRDAYVRVRRTLALDNAVAFVVLTLWRCSPPRLLPAEYGFVDVLHGGMASMPGAGAGDAPGVGGSAWTNNRFQLTIAAMPSLHFGTSLLLGLWLSRYSPHPAVRVLALLWPAAMLPTIVATANHFVTDAFVGALIPCFGWRYAHLLARLAPLQDRLFRPVRVAIGLEAEYHDGKGNTLD
ncbi:hypothetical protein GMORB2_4667 [Geosmithia morbida]|uniref:Inositolphosphotransferase Aur1/Ipt1 domain-containing protein n=1 Tax=Geosmithia morbida TaxID=1094350 RepID=A0A9P5CYL7_9HYPO|nr:uncharacterized protein GMORB2_4667 [Geosmithia morbida]KAF4119537.1 hypothetical protein GMORB2_4667 [Geosmithia morbida]